VQVVLAYYWAWFCRKWKGIVERDRKPCRGAVLAVLLVLSCLVVQSVRPLNADGAPGRVIDLYTQKAPFDGKGINQSSDAFEPQELVVLYANVTYNGFPVPQKSVAFQVIGPVNPVQNVTRALGSNDTDQNGIAQFSFRILSPSDNVESVFGEWLAIATVSIADQTVLDTLPFQVGWIIRITNVETFNEQLQPQTLFLRQKTVVFNLTVENIALTQKSATIGVDVQDSATHTIIQLQKEDMVFPPGTTYLTVSSQIPVTATLGEASILAAAYTKPPESGGVPYSPAISGMFEIITRDVAITAVKPSSMVVTSGQTLNITITARNKGNETESFGVTAYYDNTPIDRKLVSGLAPQTETDIVFEWNTSSIPPGTYVIKGVADTVPGEIEVDTADNTLVDGTVTIITPIIPPTLPLIISFWIVLLFMFIIDLIASLILLLFIGYLRRRRRKRRGRSFTVLGHPHV
jgi:hypothetical protein